MYEVVEKENIIIKNLIYYIRGEQVMLATELSVTECHGYLYDRIVTYYDIGLPISMIINYRDASSK